MTGKLSHINERGEAQMVDVGDKSASQRMAIAEATILMAPETLRIISRGEAKKGDVIATARIAGIMAAKRTHELVPMCHPLLITKAAVDFEALEDGSGLKVRAEVRVTGQTGVEMEALTAASVACLTLYDMVKAVDRGMTITDLRLVEKSGGRSGHFIAPAASSDRNDGDT
jgi:cyclic pyranopterin monophosphate synthase